MAKGWPQLDLAGALGVMRTMRRRRFRQRQGRVADRADHRVDHIQHRLGRAEAGGDGQVAELAGALPVREEIVAEAERFGAAPEILPAPGGSGADRCPGSRRSTA